MIFHQEKIRESIELLQMFCPSGGYQVAFSGGKDSQCVYHLCQEAQVPFSAFYNKTGIDPPELVQFIKRNYPDVKFVPPKRNMWDLMVFKKFPPTRWRRYCCDYLKHYNKPVKGTALVTGVRGSESAQRKAKHKFVAMGNSSKSSIHLDKICQGNAEIFKAYNKAKYINPIVHWSEADVWAYLKSREIKSSELYQQGFRRLGCIGCPMASAKQRRKEFERYPKYKALWIRAFDRLIEARRLNGLDIKDECATGEKMMQWYLNQI